MTNSSSSSVSFCIFGFFWFAVFFLFDTFALRRKNSTTLFAVAFFFFYLILFSFLLLSYRVNNKKPNAQWAPRMPLGVLIDTFQRPCGGLSTTTSSTTTTWWCFAGDGVVIGDCYGGRGGGGGGCFPPFAHCVLCWASWIKHKQNDNKTFLKFVLTPTPTGTRSYWNAIYIIETIASALKQSVTKTTNH